MKKEVLVGLDYFRQILVADRPFAGHIFFLEPLLQHLRRGLQINHQVWRGQLFAEVIVVAVVGVEFLVIQIEAGKELIFFEDEIRDYNLLRARTEIEGLQLLETPHQKCELSLKRGSAVALVKRVEKRIRIGFHHALGIQALGQKARQSALAHSDGPFHSNVPGQFEKIGHEFARCLGTAGYLG